MKTRLLIIITFVILLTVSLMAVSQMETIQKGIWVITGEYEDPILTPSLDYDYGLLYATVLEIFGVSGIVIIGIILIIWRKRK